MPLIATWIERESMKGRLWFYSHVFYGLSDGGALASLTSKTLPNRPRSSAAAASLCACRTESIEGNAGGNTASV